MTKNESKKFLGIDPGIATTGWGIIEKSGGRVSLVDYGAIITSPRDSFSERLKELHEKLDKIIRSHELEAVAVEELFFAKNVKTAMAVGQARGVILMTIMENNLPLREFTPLEVKQAITGFGRADKKQIQQMVKVLLGLKNIPQPDDAADGLAIAITLANSFKNYLK